MKLESSFPGLALLAVVTLASCERGATTSTETAVPDPDTAALMQTVDIASHAGQSFDAFSKSSGMERFALDKLDLAADERARVSRDMVVSQPSRLIAGGGAQALVFAGCLASGCNAGMAVLAFGNHGEAFVGVRDAQGTEKLIPDDRMEALLRLSSATRRWDDPDAGRSPGGAAAP